MKMRMLHRLFGKKKREKKEKRKQEREKKKKDEKMPNFKKVFSSLPNILNFKSRDIETQHVPSVQDHTAAKSAAEKKIKAEAAKDKADDICARIETAKSKNLEIIWLLQAHEDVPLKSLSELIESYGNVKDSDSYRGMSVNYAYAGKLREISHLNEQDLDGLAKKLEC